MQNEVKLSDTAPLSVAMFQPSRTTNRPPLHPNKRKREPDAQDFVTIDQAVKLNSFSNIASPLIPSNTNKISIQSITGYQGRSASPNSINIASVLSLLSSAPSVESTVVEGNDKVESCYMSNATSGHDTTSEEDFVDSSDDHSPISVENTINAKIIINHCPI